jgi:hypothetical protein
MILLPAQWALQDLDKASKILASKVATAFFADM